MNFVKVLAAPCGVLINYVLAGEDEQETKLQGGVSCPI
jgi:hypothetical protein